MVPKLIHFLSKALPVKEWSESFSQIILIIWCYCETKLFHSHIPYKTHSYCNVILRNYAVLLFSLCLLHSAKICNSYLSHRNTYRQLSADIKIKNFKIKTSFVSPSPSRTKLVLIFILIYTKIWIVWNLRIFSSVCGNIFFCQGIPDIFWHV